MDILVCGAPLDNSFQKDKLELVNKGSLGRRRKPTRANIKNLLSPSNHNTTSQPRSSTPVPPAACYRKPTVNGPIKIERFSKHSLKPQQIIEPTLIRTSPEPNHVADAQQFSIEAKLKRKKSESVGRSAVLIQTWERRTWSDSLTRQKEATAKARLDRYSTCDRCRNKENTFRNNTMPEPHACQRYAAGNAQKGESFKKGASRIRDSYADDAMLYRVPDNGPRYIKQLNMNGRKPTTGSQEPEWISLSKKLCAKFVEGYIEPNSADSYLHEEPDGVKEQPEQVSKQHRPPHHTTLQTIPPRVVEDKKPKRKVVENMTPSQTTTPDITTEPPWIHLSRKLCTKFIEEHIEYPVVPSVESSKKALLVEPNGDVRIIEKVGKPKVRKSKVRKDSEPEWVSISRKLRAKFIESHIDDPDTISMDNQLNASDPELSSESLSDTPQDVITPKKGNSAAGDTRYKDFYERNTEKAQALDTHRNRFQNNNYIRTPFPEKECCWEYQEMEFDQESNSGTFQEAEFSEDSINDYKKTQIPDVYKSNRLVTQGNTEKRNFRKENSETFTSFAESVNSQTFRNAECYNNDVHFAPRDIYSEKSRYNNSEPEKKLTVQFVSQREKEKTNRDFKNKIMQNDASPERNNGQCSFFNLTTWEEAHCKSEEPTTIFKLKNELRSKSMDNICDSDEHYTTKHDHCNGKQNANHTNPHDNLPLAKCKAIFKSEDVLDKLECKISTRNGENRSRKVGCFEENVYKTRIDQFNGHSEIFEVGVNGVSANALRSTSSDSFEPFEIAPESYENDAEHFIESDTESTKRFNEIEEKDTSKNDHVHKSKGKRFEDCESTRNDNSQNCPEHKSRRKSSGDFESIVNNDSFYPEYQSNGNGSENFDVNGYESLLIHRGSKGVVGKSEDFEITETDTQINCNARNMSRKSSKTYETDENDNSFNFSNAGEYENTEGSEKLRREISKSCDSLRIIGEIPKVIEDSEIHERPKFQSSNSQKIDVDVKEKQNHKSQHCAENKERVNGTNEQKPTGMKKHYKCNGSVPNSKEIKQVAVSKDTKIIKEEKITNGFHSECQKQIKNHEITTSKPENLYVNEYANISSSIAERKPRVDETATKMGKKSKSVHSVFHKECHSEDRSIQEKDSRRNSSGEYHDEYNRNVSKRVSSGGSSYTESIDPAKSTSMKEKSRSMYDLSKKENEHSKEVDSKHKIPMLNGNSSGVAKSRNGSAMTFQEFASESDIPLCAKLVSKQNGKLSARSVSASSNRNTSPCSESSSHVYEDMFKETTSCPSDSETSSWTVMKNNSYYINGRSSSMNDLDLSDSCSMSVKCDYASSGSEQSTLQSRHSSCTSSSFYVNLRDYDSHMLEPSLNRKKKDSKKATSNGKSTKLSNNSPPTPESLRHLFTSPFHSIHSPANRTAMLVNRLPQEPESHYYSTAAAASSAFKHGFDPTPQKQKKTERSSSVKIKDIAQGIILTFRRFQNHSKSSNVSANQYVDVSHLAESNPVDSGKPKSKKEQKEMLKKQEEKKRWRFSSENSRTDSDSGCHLTSPDVHGPKARRSSSDLSGNRPKLEILNADMKPRNGEKKKTKAGKKASNAREKAKKTRSKSIEPRPLSTVSRKVQQMPDGTLYLVTTVSGDTALPGVYSDSPDSSSELSSHRPVKMTGESNC